MSINIFELELNDGQKVPLKWGTYAMKLLCVRMDITLDAFFDLLQEIADGNTTEHRMLELLENFLHVGYEFSNGTKATDIQVCEWIDGCGGVAKINSGPLVAYINYVFSVTLTGVTPLNEEADNGDKKKED